MAIKKKELIKFSDIKESDLRKIAEDKQMFFHADHDRPRSRRDFLKTGMLAASATVVAPSLLTFLANNGVAQSTINCADILSGTLQWPGFLQVNLSGGAGLTGNFYARRTIDPNLPLSQRNEESNLEFLNSYSRLGLGNGVPSDFAGGGTVDQTMFANPFPVVRNAADETTGGQFFRGIREIAGAAVLAQTSATAMVVASMDDTGTNNKFGPQGLIQKAASIRSIKHQVYPHLSTRNTSTLAGVRQDIAGREIPAAPLVVNRIDDLYRAMGNSAAETPSNKNVVLSDTEKTAIARTLSSLSPSQSETVSSTGTGTFEMFKRLFRDATGKNYCQKTAPAPAVDPYTDAAFPELNTIWADVRAARPNVNFITNDNLVHSYAAIANSAVRGWTATAGIDLGGFDYHNNDRTNVTDPRDRAAGQIVGGALRTASVLGQPLVVFITSDGAVGTSGTNYGDDWSSDRGSGGSALIFMYHPTQDLSAIDTQLGEFGSGRNRDGQAAVDATPVGAPELATFAFFYRYLKFSGDADWQVLADEVLDSFALSQDDLDYIVKF